MKKYEYSMYESGSSLRQRNLNEYGNNGWQLAGYSSDSGLHSYIFMREIVELAPSNPET